MFAHNVPIIVNTLEQYGSSGIGAPGGLAELRRAQARSVQDAADTRARSDLAQAWLAQTANIDVAGGGRAYIPWDIAEVDKEDAQLQARQFVAAEHSGDRAQLTALELDLKDHQSDRQWLAGFWSQPGVAAAAGNLAAMLAASDRNHLTDPDSKLLTTYATSLAAAYNLGGLCDAQSKQLTDGPSAVAARNPGPVAALLQSAPNAGKTMSALAAAIEHQDLLHYWEPGRLVPDWSNLIPDSAGHLMSDEEGALYFGTAGYLFSKYGIGYRTMLPGTPGTPWPVIPRADRLPVTQEITALGKQWAETDSGLLVPSGMPGADPRVPLPPDDLGAGWKTGVNAGLRADPVNVPGWARYGSRGLFVAGSGLTLYSEWEQTWQDDQALRPTWSTPERVADAAGQTTVVGGSTVAGAWAGAEVGAEGGATAGAAIGSIFPGPGTVSGAWSAGWSAVSWAGSPAVRWGVRSGIRSGTRENRYGTIWDCDRVRGAWRSRGIPGSGWRAGPSRVSRGSGSSRLARLHREVAALGSGPLRGGIPVLPFRAGLDVRGRDTAGPLLADLGSGKRRCRDIGRGARPARAGDVLLRAHLSAADAPAVPAALVPEVPPVSEGTAMTAPAWASVTHPASGARAPVPPGWQPELDAGAPVVLVSPPAPGRAPRFRPNMVVTIEQPPPAMAGLAAYTASSITGMQRMLTGFHVIAIDVITMCGHDGRRVLCGHRDGTYALATEHWWTVAEGVATTLTASCQVEDYLDLAELFEETAAGMVPARGLDRGRAP